MKLVNRISLIITPKQPMYQWLQQVAAEEVTSLEELQLESSCYLLDEPTDEIAISPLKQQLVEQHYRMIWQSELEVWDEFLDQAPELKDLAMFLEWFDVKFSGLTFDLASNNLMVANTQ
ncbi:hypothetical protein [Psychrobium sp. 1_MG-2023]|uniref:hypothetical protein n=1 Tax=Psychrobium sp. 1_MG-2023 TaxID=3062624 RepID=UPI000C31BC96|nr:hypothetical protein [Psychrobium sp. 1_MG-2023]MDP2562263.1 hypothetical protein [Psychrobium sp. 1_MG-2023]PKF57513.1 hypothetical protein CW748_06370 [Alteromonadales bacterium alter-6D02]